MALSWATSSMGLAACILLYTLLLGIYRITPGLQYVLQTGDWSLKPLAMALPISLNTIDTNEPTVLWPSSLARFFQPSQDGMSCTPTSREANGTHSPSASRTCTRSMDPSSVSAPGNCTLATQPSSTRSTRAAQPGATSGPPPPA